MQVDFTMLTSMICIVHPPPITHLRVVVGHTFDAWLELINDLMRENHLEQLNWQVRFHLLPPRVLNNQTIILRCWLLCERNFPPTRRAYSKGNGAHLKFSKTYTNKVSVFILQGTRATLSKWSCTNRQPDLPQHSVAIPKYLETTQSWYNYLATFD